MIVAGTGHRPNKLGGYSTEAFHKLVSIAEEWLIENKPEKVITGMALGWDQALARAANKLNIPFVAAVPFEGQPDAWTEESQLYYFYLLGKADEVIETSGKGYAAWKMQKRNQWMVDNADTILAMYDGTSGGTANCIRYATEKNKPIINLYAKLS
jgi:uncharacterized phage-like protein YoqJ